MITTYYREKKLTYSLVGYVMRNSKVKIYRSVKESN